MSITRGGIKSCINEGTLQVLTLYIKESFCCCLLCERVVHPHLVYSFSNDTDLVNAVTRRAASFCIFCNAYEYCSEHPSHTTDSYSTTGKI